VDFVGVECSEIQICGTDRDLFVAPEFNDWDRFLRYAPAYVLDLQNKFTTTDGIVIPAATDRQWMSIALDLERQLEDLRCKHDRVRIGMSRRVVHDITLNFLHRAALSSGWRGRRERPTSSSKFTEEEG
jgi:hypothetical protein